MVEGYQEKILDFSPRRNIGLCMPTQQIILQVTCHIFSTELDYWLKGSNVSNQKVLILFQEDDNFTRTECFHFFHDVCMACHVMSYVESIERKTESSPFEKKEETSLDLVSNSTSCNT